MRAPAWEWPKQHNTNNSAARLSGAQKKRRECCTLYCVEEKVPPSAALFNKRKFLPARRQVELVRHFSNAQKHCRTMFLRISKFFLRSTFFEIKSAGTGGNSLPLSLFDLHRSDEFHCNNTSKNKKSLSCVFECSYYSHKQKRLLPMGRVRCFNGRPLCLKKNPK